MSEQSTALRESATKLVQAGDYTGAVGKLQEALSLDPQDGKAHGLLGICQARLGDLSSALQSLNAAVQLQPTDVSARYNLANALFQANQLDNARTQAQQTLALNPEHENAKQLLARIGAAQPPAPPAPTFAAAAPLDPGAGQVYVQPAAPAPWAPAPPMQPAPTPAPWGQPPSQMPYTPPPPSAFTAPPPQPAYSPNAAQQGMQYRPLASQVAHQPPGVGLRLARGLFWGAVFSQWWTLWRVISIFMWHSNQSSTMLIIEVLLWVIGYGFFGAVAGLIIGASNAEPQVGAVIGIVVALIVCGLRALLFQSPAFLISVFFFFVTGRSMGASIAAKVQRPIGQ